MTLNYWMMVERYPNQKEEVGGLNPGCENLYLPGGQLPLCFGLLSGKKN
jgi:hypothetical protein